jgi:hypothetical protein
LLVPSVVESDSAICVPAAAWYHGPGSAAWRACLNLSAATSTPGWEPCGCTRCNDRIFWWSALEDVLQ